MMRKVFTLSITLLVFVLQARAVTDSFSSGVITIDFRDGGSHFIVQQYGNDVVNPELTFSTLQSNDISKIKVIGDITNCGDNKFKVLQKLLDNRGQTDIDFSEASGFSYDDLFSNDFSTYQREAKKIILPNGFTVPSTDDVESTSNNGYNPPCKIKASQYICADKGSALDVYCASPGAVASAINGGELPFSDDVTTINLLNSNTEKCNDDDRAAVSAFNQSNVETTYEDKVLTLAPADATAETLPGVVTQYNASDAEKVVFPDGSVWEKKTAGGKFTAGEGVSDDDAAAHVAALKAAGFQVSYVEDGVLNVYPGDESSDVLPGVVEALNASNVSKVVFADGSEFDVASGELTAVPGADAAALSNALDAAGFTVSTTVSVIGRYVTQFIENGVTVTKVTPLEGEEFNEGVVNSNLTDAEKDAIKNATYLRLVGDMHEPAVSKLAEINEKTGITLDLTDLTYHEPNLNGPEASKIKKLGSFSSKVETVYLPSNARYTAIPAEYASGSTIKNLYMPDNYKTIGDKAFKGCSDLSYVDWSANLEEIGTDNNSKDVGAFQGTALTGTLDLSGTKVKVIGKDAFHGTPITSVIFNNATLQTIGGEAFHATNLSTVNLSSASSLKKIGFEAFEECFSLTSITFPSGTALTDIGNDCFRKSGLISVDMSMCQGITKFGNNPTDATDYRTFSESTSLESIQLPPALVEVPAGLFTGCTSLNTVIFTGTAQTGTDDVINDPLLDSNKLVIKANAFFALTSLQNVTFSSNLTEIDDLAFSQSGIVEADFQNCHHLTLVDDKSFANCPNLENVVFCSHPKYIYGPNGAFNETTSIKTVEVKYCNGTDVTECVCGYQAFAYDITAAQTDEGSVDNAARLIYPKGDNASEPYNSNFDFFVGDYKTGKVINHDNLLSYYRNVPQDGENARDAYGNPIPDVAKYKGNGWLEFINVGETVPINPDPNKKFLRTYSRDAGSGPVLLPTGDKAINAYRVLDYKSTAVDEDDIAGYLVLAKLETTIDGQKYSYVPEETGVVLYSTKNSESGILVLPPYPDWEDMSAEALEALFPKFKNTGAGYYDPATFDATIPVSERINREDANMLQGSYGNPAHVAPVWPWDYDKNSYGRVADLKYRNFTLSIKVGSAEDNPVYQWRRLKPSWLRANRAYAQLPISRFIYDDEQSSQMPLLNEDDNMTEGEGQASVGMFFEDEEATSIVVIDSKGNLVDDDAWYTLQGVKVSVPQKGIYIHNNKKVIIK